jgi:hypothetical protein
MKFTKEEAFESLKGILTNSGKKPLRMSERSIQKQLESLMPLVANDEMELNDFIAKVKDTFSVMNSNAEKDNSDFVNQWKREHPDQEPEPIGGSGSDNPQIKTLMDEIKAMREEMNAGKRENAIKAKRNELASALKGKGVKDDEWINAYLSEINITEDMDVDAKADSSLKVYNRSRADMGDGVNPRSASNGDTKKYKTMFDDIRKEREKMQENEKV